MEVSLWKLTARVCSWPALGGEQEDSWSVGVRGSWGAELAEMRGQGVPEIPLVLLPAPNSLLWKGAKPRNLMYSEAWASLVAQMVKNLPATWETRVRSLSWEDPVEKEMTTHSSILAWRIPRTEEPGRLVHGIAKSRARLSNWHTEQQPHSQGLLLRNSEQVLPEAHLLPLSPEIIDDWFILWKE